MKKLQQPHNCTSVPETLEIHFVGCRNNIVSNVTATPISSDKHPDEFKMYPNSKQTHSTTYELSKPLSNRGFKTLQLTEIHGIAGLHRHKGLEQQPVQCSVDLIEGRCVL